jgi:hypothetical protein
MAWELNVVHANGHRLGSPKEVMAAISRALPDVGWEVVPPLLEQIKDDPDHPVHAQLPTWSEEARRRAALPKTVGCLEGDGFSFEIYGIDDDPVEDFYIDVRGGGDPIAALMRLKTQHRWSIKEVALNRPLDESQLRERWDAHRRRQV